MDVLSTLSSYFYWGESDSQDGTLTPPTEAEVEERLGGAEEEEDEWILVGKKGRNVRRKNSKEEDEVGYTLILIRNPFFGPGFLSEIQISQILALPT